jgi:hypothetical protein
MTLKIELTPEAAKRVKEARKRGLDVDRMLSRLIIEQLPETIQELRQEKEPETGEAVYSEQEERRRSVLKAYGKYRGIAPSVDEFLRRKQEDLAKEEGR